MKIGVLGSGDVAKVLASALLKHGHQVKVGSRTAGKLRIRHGRCSCCGEVRI